MTSTSENTSINAKSPVTTIRSRNLNATIWQQPTVRKPFYTVTFDRSYQDNDQQWKSSRSFSVADLPLLADLAEDARITILNLLSGNGEE